MKNLFTFLFAVVFLVSCSMEEPASETPDPLDNQFFTEFMPCKAGPDFNSENMTAMISEWQKLLSAEDLQGVWGYAPDGDSNSVGDTGWWEIQWTSEESADQAWEEWLENEDAMAWQEKYESVLSCDGESRNAFDSVFPIPSATYGELPDSGYFYSEVYICELNEGFSKEDAVNFLYGFREAVANADYSDTSYHLGNYFFHDDPSSFLWMNFTNSKEAMNKAAASFEAEVREDMFPLFSEFASCGEKPDLYNGFTLYWSENKDFMPTFPSDS
jgi:hypothetical protein